MSGKNELTEYMKNSEYKYGFRTNVESNKVPNGVNEDIIRLISGKKSEPKWLLDWRLKAYREWKKMVQPTWGNLSTIELDFENICCYSEPKCCGSFDCSSCGKTNEINPEILDTYEKLGVFISPKSNELSGVAVDAVFDSVSVATTFKKQLQDLGIIFCPFSEAVINYPDLIEKYLGSVVS